MLLVTSVARHPPVLALYANVRLASFNFQTVRHGTDADCAAISQITGCGTCQIPGLRPNNYRKRQVNQAGPFSQFQKAPGGIPNIPPSNSKLSYSSPHPSLHLVIDNALSLSAHPFGSHPSHFCRSPSPLSQKSFAQENVSQERQLNPRFSPRSARSSHILHLLNSPSKSHFLRPSLSVCHRISLAAHYKPQVFASFAPAASNSLYTHVFIHIPSASFL